MDTLEADTFPALLRALLRDNPGRPLVTAYDDATGERTELSVTTYANWVAKTANLFVDEYLLGEGDTIRLALPPHWLTTVFLGAAWSAGVAVTTDPHTATHLVVTGPDIDVARADAPVLACSLLPFAVRLPKAPPDGVDDYGALWPGQPDVFVASPEPQPGTVACRHGTSSHSQQQLHALAREARWAGRRLLTDVDPTGDCGAATFLAAAVRGGSLVLVSHPDEERWPARLEGERATDVLRSSP